MIRHISLGLVAGLISFAASCHAEPTRFRIDAKYQGGISVDLGRLGEATLTFQPQKDGNIRVTGKGNVKHPKDRTDLAFGLDMAFRIEGNWVRTAWSRNTSNEAGKKLIEKIERIIPFVHVASTMGAGQRHFMTKFGALGVTTRLADGFTETMVEDGPNTLVTFYARKTAGGQVLLEKFKVPTKEGALLSFTADRPLDFASLRSPAL